MKLLSFTFQLECEIQINTYLVDLYIISEGFFFVNNVIHDRLKGSGHIDPKWNDC